MIKLRPYQEQAKAEIFHAWEAELFRNVLLRLPTGGGKCSAKDTPILMYDGTIKMVQDIKVGEKLMGPDSKPRTVLSTCTGREEMFKVIPVKGDCHTFNRSHIMTLRASYTEAGYVQGELYDISINDYLQKSKTFKHRLKWCRTGVEFDEKPIEFDPWFVGLYLAEGSKHDNRITNPDKEVINYLKTNYDITTHNEIEHFIKVGVKGRNPSKLTELRKEICPLEGDRNIPDRYKINSRSKRLKLLAGLIDGDGHLHHNGYEIVTKYTKLNDDILFLARSLGLAAYSTLTTKTIKSSGYEGQYYVIKISGHTDMIPCRIDRKKALPRKQIKNVLNTGFKLESQGEGDYYGFELEGDGRYLLGDFSITHNTQTFCQIVADTLYTHRSAIMVHRKELVQQICLTLAGRGIEHNIIASTTDIRGIIKAERRIYKRSFYQPNATVSVISVDTLNARADNYREWCASINQLITDEAAHVLRDNKWGRAQALFVNARSLGVTATPERLDRKGLGSHADGLYDTMVEGPDTYWMIQNGFLSKYKVAIPKSDYQSYLKSSSDKSDYSKKAMMEAAKKSHIVGDVVTEYIKHASGKQAILFATDIQTAKDMERQFNQEGIKAKALDSTCSDKERLENLIKFEQREIKILINVDLFDEGLDVPGIECVIMARPTKSLGKYLQMIGRGLRLAEGKEFAIIIDHVGNIMEHGLPDQPRTWTLDRIRKSGKKNNFLKICGNPMCNSPYDRSEIQCPWCGFEAIPNARGESGGRTPPEMVDGDLELLDPDTLRELQGMAILEAPAVVGERVSKAVNGAAGISAMKRQAERIEMQKHLSESIAMYAGKLRSHGYTDRKIHKRFYLEFGMTITEALGQTRADMEKLKERLT